MPHPNSKLLWHIFRCGTCQHYPGECNNFKELVRKHGVWYVDGSRHYEIGDRKEEIAQ